MSVANVLFSHMKAVLMTPNTRYTISIYECVSHTCSNNPLLMIIMRSPYESGPYDSSISLYECLCSFMSVVMNS